MRILAKIDVANVGGGLNTSSGGVAKEPAAAVAFSARLHGSDSILEESHKDESLKIFSKYVRNPDLGIMAYLYEEISTRVEARTAPAGRSGARVAGFGGAGFSASEAPELKKTTGT